MSDLLRSAPARHPVRLVLTLGVAALATQMAGCGNKAAVDEELAAKLTQPVASVVLTAAPAAAISRPDLGTFTPGAAGDASILSLDTGRFDYVDSVGEHVLGTSRLSAQEGARLARVARVWALALDVWQSEGEARDFLFRAHPMLEDRLPVDVVIQSEIGAELVLDVLGRLKYGTAA